MRRLLLQSSGRRTVDVSVESGRLSRLAVSGRLIGRGGVAPLVKPGEDSKWKSRAQVAREFPQSPQGRLRQQRPRSAGSSASSTRMFRRVVCVTNAPVPQGRLCHQRNVALKPWGGPPSCDPAPLTTSLRGLWVSGNAGTGQWWGEQRGGDPRTDRATQRGGDPKTDLRKEELSRQLGRGVP